MQQQQNKTRNNMKNQNMQQQQQFQQAQNFQMQNQQLNMQQTPMQQQAFGQMNQQMPQMQQLPQMQQMPQQMQNMQQFPPQFFNNNAFGYQRQQQYQQYQQYQQQQYQQESNLESQKYDDDEPLQKSEKNEMEIEKPKEEIQQAGKKIEDMVQFSLTSMKKAVKLNSKEAQIIPAMVSLKAQEVQEDAQNMLKNRQNIDLICVIDRSGSMSGSKLKYVKDTLHYILSYLNENDRLSLIQFDHNAQRLCPLLRITDSNKSKISTIIDGIRDNGGTDIQKGMEHAVKLIKERKEKNAVTSVFLLSDGCTSNRDGCLSFLDRQNLKENPFTIQSFGFGNDHDPELMSNIAKIKDGNFYYVQDIKQVDEMFVDALGGLFSVFGQNIKIQVKLKNQMDKFKEISFAKTYGEMWKDGVNDNKYVKECQTKEINLIQLISGVNKEFVCELKIPAIAAELQDFERNPVLLEAFLELDYDKKGQQTQKIKLQANLELTFYNEKEVIPEESQKKNEDVEFNYLRVRGAEVIKNCMNLAEQGKYNEGQQLISQMQGDIKQAMPQNQQKLSILNNDLEDNKQSCNAQKYHQEGRFKMMNNNQAHMFQQSRPQCNNMNAMPQMQACQYNNQMQQQMQCMAQQRK